MTWPSLTCAGRRAAWFVAADTERRWLGVAGPGALTSICSTTRPQQPSQVRLRRRRSTMSLRASRDYRAAGLAGGRRLADDLSGRRASSVRPGPLRHGRWSRRHDDRVDVTACREPRATDAGRPHHEPPDDCFRGVWDGSADLMATTVRSDPPPCRGAPTTSRPTTTPDARSSALEVGLLGQPRPPALRPSRYAARSLGPTLATASPGPSTPSLGLADRPRVVHRLRHRSRLVRGGRAGPTRSADDRLSDSAPSAYAEHLEIEP